MGMFNYNSDFYPTPANVIERMMMDEDVTGKVVLEPSAGKGDIVDWLAANGAKEVLACEKDVNLLPYLAGKCRIVGYDFLKLRAEDVSHVQMIVMNPPFSQGIEHIRHAWEIAPAGCTIIALCNHANFECRYKALSLDGIITDNGYRENLGCVFKNAERVTGVQVELVKLFKHGDGGSEFDGYFFDGYDADAMGGGEEGLMRYNLVRDLVQRYKTAVGLFDNAMETARHINEVAMWTDGSEESVLTREHRLLPIRFEAHRNGNNNPRTGPVTHAEYRKELQKYYWKIIFRKMNMEKYATQKLREDINRYVENNSARPFTMANIYRVLNIVVQTNGQRMQKAIEEAFDLICSLSAENSTAGEKWKTNSNYMVNRRFICDWITEKEWGGGMTIRYCGFCDHAEPMEDVAKALCYLTGKDYNEIGSLRSYVYNHKQEIEWGQWFEWGFFRCRGYKKGTMHFEFIDEDVWARFNQTVAQARGWHIGKQAEGKKRPAAA